MNEIISFIFIGIVFYALGRYANRRQCERKIKTLQLANRILREELDSEKKKTATLRELVNARRSHYAQN